MLKALGSIPSTSKMTLLQLMNLVSCSLSPSSRNLRQEDHAKTDSCDIPLLMIAHYWLWFMLGQTCLRLDSCTVRHLLPTINDLIWSTFSILKKKKTLSAVCLFLHHLVGVNQYTAYLDWHPPFMALSLTRTSWQGMSSPCLTPGNNSATVYNAFLFWASLFEQCAEDTVRHCPELKQLIAFPYPVELVAQTYLSVDLCFCFVFLWSDTG